MDSSRRTSTLESDEAIEKNGLNGIVVIRIKSHRWPCTVIPRSRCWLMIKGMQYFNSKTSTYAGTLWQTKYLKSITF
jgi:hypothetical protein